MSYIGPKISPVNQSDLLGLLKADQVGTDIGQIPALIDDGSGNAILPTNIAGNIVKRNIFVSDQEPTNDIGENGDIWFKI